MGLRQRLQLPASPATPMMMALPNTPTAPMPPHEMTTPSTTIPLLTQTSTTTITTQATTATTNANRRSTRSMTATTRAQLAKRPKSQCKKRPKSRAKTKRYVPKPSVCPKKVKVGKSLIPNAGNGLFIMEDVKNKTCVARYSGERIDLAENNKRKGHHYRIKISNDLFLDAEDPRHFEGRFINDGKRAGIKPNVRFAAGYRTNTCSTTSFSWIRIFATRNIKAGEELYLDYGPDYWIDIDAESSASTIARTPSPSATTQSALRPAPITTTAPKRTLFDYWPRATASTPTTYKSTSTTTVRRPPPPSPPPDAETLTTPSQHTPERTYYYSATGSQWAAPALIPASLDESPWAAPAFVPGSPPTPPTPRPLSSNTTPRHYHPSSTIIYTKPIIHGHHNHHHPRLDHSEFSPLKLSPIPNDLNPQHNMNDTFLPDPH